VSIKSSQPEGQGSSSVNGVSGGTKVKSQPVLAPRSGGNLNDTGIREFFILLILIVILLSFGTMGYILIEGWGGLDALYMTVITLAGVGFQEVHPLSTYGRIFTIIIILLGFGVVAVFFSTITHLVVQRQLNWVFRGKRVKDIIKKLQNHTLICGFGRIARIAAKELKIANVDLVIIESDRDRAEEARELGYLVIEGDATDDETLIEAGIRRAARVISLLPKGSDNLYVVLTSRELNSALFIVTRAEDDKFERRLERAGADRLFSPYRLGGQRIAEGIIRPYVTNFLDLAAASNNASLSLEELRIPGDSGLVGSTLRGVDLRKKCNVIVAAVISDKGEMMFNPHADTRIEGGATFIVLGERNELTKLENLIIAK
jgi:voltage-gated potassium channel